MEKEFASEVHIFISSESGKKIDIEGLKFYDRSPEMPAQELTGILGGDVYLTNIHSIERTKWDDEINKEGEAVEVNYMDGSNSVKTYVVSEEKFYEIVNSIMSQTKERKDGMIKIDMSDCRDKKVRGSLREERAGEDR